MIWKQKEFNGSVARTLNEATKKISDISQIVTSERASVMVVSETTRMISEISQKTIELENEAAGRIRSEISRKVDEQIGLVRSEIGGRIEEKVELARSEIGGRIEEQIGLVRAEINGKVDEKIELVRAEINNEITTQVKAMLSAMNQEIESRAGLASILERNMGNYQSMKTPTIEQEFGINYFLFEEKFRGHRADIKQRQLVFIPYFEACKTVVDIGCGRGEFLELIREQGIIGKGIDIDKDMVSFCKSRGLNVDEIDAISYLETIEDKSIDGIFIDQVIEHLDPDYLIKMIDLCYKKLIFGGILIAETVNPLSFASFANFYIDLSHKRPMHPDTLRFILGFVGFREMEIKFLSPVSEDVRLRKIDVEHSNEKEKRLIENYNYNVNTINNVLFGAQDYAVIVKK
jgi:O-antigen chain-terminating methyltransferase